MKVFLFISKIIHSSTCTVPPPAFWGNHLHQFSHSSIFNFFFSGVGPVSCDLLFHLPFDVWSHLSPIPCLSSALVLIKWLVPPFATSHRSSFVLILIDLPLAFNSVDHSLSPKMFSVLVLRNATLSWYFFLPLRAFFKSSFVSFSCSDLWISGFSRSWFWALFSHSFPWWLSPLLQFRIPSLWQWQSYVYLQTTSLCPADHCGRIQNLRGTCNSMGPT